MGVKECRSWALQLLMDFLTPNSSLWLHYVSFSLSCSVSARKHTLLSVWGSFVCASYSALFLFQAVPPVSDVSSCCAELLFEGFLLIILSLLVFLLIISHTLTT